MTVAGKQSRIEHLFKAIDATILITLEEVDERIRIRMLRCQDKTTGKPDWSTLLADITSLDSVSGVGIDFEAGGCFSKAVKLNDLTSLKINLKLMTVINTSSTTLKETDTLSSTNYDSPPFESSAACACAGSSQVPTLRSLFC